MIKIIKSFLKAFLKIKIVKALIGVIVVLLGYKYIRYFIRFNKFIIYILGLLFVGIGWNDIYIFNELKLAYDSLKLYLLAFLPNNNVKIDRDNFYVISDKIPEVKSIRNEIKESNILMLRK